MISASATTLPTLEPEELEAFGREMVLAPGDSLRIEGKLYGDMHVLLDGEVEVRFGASSGREPIIATGRGTPIGEIAFLLGIPATASVTARTRTRSLYIDNGRWDELERSRPDLASKVYRILAEVAEGRQSYNLTFAESGTIDDQPTGAEVLLCQSEDLLVEAQRLRYEVYCEELSRSSPHADHSRRIITDDLDAKAYVLLALEGGKPTATMRMNMARDGTLGVLEELYGMSQSPLHREATGIATKFIVRKDNRLGSSAFRLMATAMDMAHRYGVRHCFIDCIPSLRPFYAGLGFAQSGPPFLHRENGRSYPMMLDLDRYAKRIARVTSFAMR